MSGLSRWLTWDKEKDSVGRGPKEPAFVEIPVSPQLENVIVSSPAGDYRLVDRSGRDTEFQRVGMFELDWSPANEDAEQARLVSFLYREGASRDWGNVADLESLDEDTLDDIEAYFDAFDLTYRHIHSGETGLEQISEMAAFSPTVELPDDPTDDDYRDIMDEHYAIGKLDGTPVFYNVHLDDKVMWSADSEYIGIGVRIKDRVGILVHNPERAAVISKII